MANLVFALVFPVQLFHSFKKKRNSRPPFALQEAIMCTSSLSGGDRFLWECPTMAEAEHLPAMGTFFRFKPSAVVAVDANINARHFRFRYGDPPSPSGLAFILSALRTIRNCSNQAKPTSPSDADSKTGHTVFTPLSIPPNFLTFSALQNPLKQPCVLQAAFLAGFTGFCLLLCFSGFPCWELWVQTLALSGPEFLLFWVMKMSSVLSPGYCIVFSYLCFII